MYSGHTEVRENGPHIRSLSRLFGFTQGGYPDSLPHLSRALVAGSEVLIVIGDHVIGIDQAVDHLRAYIAAIVVIRPNLGHQIVLRFLVADAMKQLAPCNRDTVKGRQVYVASSFDCDGLGLRGQGNQQDEQK